MACDLHVDSTEKAVRRSAGAVTFEAQRQATP
jgi:hypothetical protein